MATDNNPPNVSASTTLVSAMSQMMLDPDFADLNVKCGDKEWKLHTALLAARSPFFEAAISTNMKEKLNMEIYIKDMDPEAMEQVVNFVYGIDVEKGPIEDLFEAAERFQMKDLMDNASKFALKQMSSDNVLWIGRVAELYSVEHVLEECAKYVVKNDVEIKEDMAPKLATIVLRIFKEDITVGFQNIALSVEDAVRMTKEYQAYKIQKQTFKDFLLNLLVLLFCALIYFLK